MCISDWSSDVCSSDLHDKTAFIGRLDRSDARAITDWERKMRGIIFKIIGDGIAARIGVGIARHRAIGQRRISRRREQRQRVVISAPRSRCTVPRLQNDRSEEHTSELQSLMRISYAVFCLKKKNNITKTTITQVKI